MYGVLRDRLNISEWPLNTGLFVVLSGGCDGGIWQLATSVYFRVVGDGCVCKLGGVRGRRGV